MRRISLFGLKLLGAVEVAAAFVGAIMFMMFFFIPIADYVVYWLREAIIPERDLYWALAEPFCGKPGGDGGWLGMHACREEHILQTGWVGLDMIIHFVMGLPLPLVSAISAWAGGAILLAIEMWRQERIAALQKAA